MRSIRAVVPLALALGDVVELTYPSLVRVRVARAERALERATRKIEHSKIDKAAVTFKVVRRQLAAAWRGARYVIRTAPPPPAEEDALRPGARKSGDPPLGKTYASPAQTAIRVLDLHHTVAAEVAQLIDGSHGTGLDALSRTLNLADDRRDSALDYILSVAPPPPAEEDRVRARKSQEEDDAAPTFAILMPTVIPDLDDELQGIEGLKSDATDLTAGGRRVLNAAEAQVTRTKAFVNAHWPPIPPED